MKISNITFTNKIKIPFKSASSHCMRKDEGDSFVKTSNKDVSDEMSFENFNKWAQSNDFVSQANEITNVRGKILGSGFEGITYEIPKTDNWVLKRYKRSYFVPIHAEKPAISQIKDISPELNIGQTIAQVQIPSNNPNYSYQYWILKKQTGKTYGICDEFSDFFNSTISLKHINSLKTASELPQEAYDKCIKDIDYITKQGYAFDFRNPNNIMIDSDKNEIHFVDINDKHNGCKEQYAKVLYSLLDADFGKNFNNKYQNSEEGNEAYKYSDKIINKFFTAMKNQNVKFDSQGYINELIDNNMLNCNLKCSSKNEQLGKLVDMELIG